MEKKNSGEKINEMPESKVWSNENSACFDVKKTQEIKKCLKPHQFKPEKEATTSVADTDESEEQRLEKSDEECLNHFVIKQLLGKTT